ncbi:MAG: hypothetical protein ACR2N9_02385 [Acidimicrobiia bacterium]
MLIAVTVLASAACSATPAPTSTTARPVEQATLTSTSTTTTTEAPTSTAATASFVTTGNRVDIYDAEPASHIVVLIHGVGSGPGSVEKLANRLNEDGAIVVAPNISLTGSTASMGTPTSETACAVWFAHNLDTSVPLVMVGFSGGGLATGQHVADPSRVADADLCSTPYEPTTIAGAVILDGPVWLEGYCRATGFCDADDASVSLFDPVAYALPNPDLAMEYFFSDDIADYPEEAAAMLDDRLGTTSPTTRSDTTHTGLLRPEFYDLYADAVLRIANG